MEREKRERYTENEKERERVWQREVKKRERELVGEIIECERERESGKKGWILKNAAKMKKLESALSLPLVCVVLSIL